MADPGALCELKNQQRPARRLDKTYGKKKGPSAEARAMHLALFGGGQEENRVVDRADKMDKPNVLTADHGRNPPVPSVTAAAAQEASHTKQQSANPIQNPRLRGRRKAITSRRMATLTPAQHEKLKPLLSLTHQDLVRDFQEFGRSIGKKYMCSKLGEGAYADVYTFQPKDLDEATELEKRGGLVVKVIPFNIENSKNDDIVDLDAVTREVRTMQTVDSLHGFVRCRGVHVVSGGYPDVLLEAFDNFKVTHRRSQAQNRRPTENVAPDQLYVILEMSNAGTTLLRFKIESVFQVFDIFWKTAIFLAFAEKQVEFEHRDLHNANICVKPLVRSGPTDVKKEVCEDMEGAPDMILGLSNLDVNIIDYTLSRVKIPIDAEGELVVFDPIACWEVSSLQAETEADQRQYDTYYKVRDWAKAAEDQAKAMARMEGIAYESQGKYARFLPKSNVFWLAYLLADLLSRSPTGRGAVREGSSKAAKRLQLDLWRSLGEVGVYLNGTAPTLLPESADDFIATAVEQQWLAPTDLATFKAQLEE